MEEKLLKKFLDYCITEKGLSINTVKSYENDLRAFLRYLEEQKNSAFSCRKDDIVQYLLTLKEKGYSSASVARILSSIKQFFRYLIFEGNISHDPTEVLKSP